MSTPIEAAPEPADAQESRGAFPPAFRRLMANSLVAGVTSTFLWFALTFWVYLETRSVVATGVIGGAFAIFLEPDGADSDGFDHGCSPVSRLGDVSCGNGVMRVADPLAPRAGVQP